MIAKDLIAASSRPLVLSILSEGESANQKADSALEYAGAVHDSHLTPINSLLQRFRDQLRAQADTNNAEYVAARENFLTTTQQLFAEFPAH